jgi:DNA-3-methyladenine glycosylase I
MTSEKYKHYHDEEWGVPVYDDQKQFEFLVLESAQAGLSWSTVLHKRENYRIAYEGFDVHKVAAFDDVKIEEMLKNPGLIRNRAKITSSIGNAKQFIAIQEEFGSFSNYLWGFVGNKPLINHWQSLQELPGKTPLSDAIAKDLKKRGFKFLGSTIVYAHLQATGLVMDHLTTCWRYNELS